MISLKCSKCNAELLPDAKFCRRCGNSVTAVESAAALSSSELPTITLEQRSDLNTRNLAARVTSPETPLRPIVAATDVGTSRRSRLLLVGTALLVVLLLGIASSVAYRRIIARNQAAEDAALIYPGSQRIVDLSSGDGRSIQLQTTDSLEQVIAWYEKSIKPYKTMRLTSTSVVLKNEGVTATVASEAGKTNILIKIVRR